MTPQHTQTIVHCTSNNRISATDAHAQQPNSEALRTLLSLKHLCRCVP